MGRRGRQSGGSLHVVFTSAWRSLAHQENKNICAAFRSKRAKGERGARGARGTCCSTRSSLLPSRPSHPPPPPNTTMLQYSFWSYNLHHKVAALSPQLDTCGHPVVPSDTSTTSASSRVRLTAPAPPPGGSTRRGCRKTIYRRGRARKRREGRWFSHCSTCEMVQ